jgi:hypothetical protein
MPSANTSLPFEDKIDIFDDDHRKNFVIPAPYQVRDKLRRESRKALITTWIPAFAGMTRKGIPFSHCIFSFRPIV